jgi:transmembrane sensor
MNVMNNEIGNIETDRLIYRFKNNEATDDEERMLLDWVKLSDENKKHFARTISLLNTIENIDASFDADVAYNEFNSRNKRHKKFFLSRKIFAVAASIIIFLSVAITVVYINFSAVTQMEVTAQHDVLLDTLPDNSIVAIAEGSKIIYPSRFKGNLRNIVLEGEAFFSVEPDKKKPFTVNIGPVKVEVLGTSFHVHHDSIQKNITIIVETGLVRVDYDKGNISKKLTPGQKVVINLETALYEEETVSDKNYKAWFTHELEFNSTSLPDVIHQLNRLYAQKMVIADESLDSTRLTAKISDLPQASVVQILQKSLGIEIIDNGEILILVGGAESN